MMSPTPVFDPNMPVLPSADTPPNPLMGLELDLTYIDAMSSMLKVNNIMLNQMILSDDCRWPSRLKLEKREVDDPYNIWIQKQIGKEFSFYKYYGAGKISELFSINGIGQRIMIEISKQTLKRLVHQRKVLDYRPDGCGSPAIYGEACVSDAKCKQYERDRKGVCGYFDKPLEDQILESLVQGKSLAWVDRGIRSKCLTPVKGTKNVRKNFQDAFESLLNPKLIRRYKKSRKEYEVQKKKEADIAYEIAQLEAKQAKAEVLIELDEIEADYVNGKEVSLDFWDGEESPNKKAKFEKYSKFSEEQKAKKLKALDENTKKLEAEIKKREPVIDAYEVKLAAQEVKTEAVYDAYELLLEEATKQIVVDKKTQPLVKNMLLVSETIENNLWIALGSLGPVLTKCSFDTSYALSHAAELPFVAMIMARETAAQNPGMTPTQLLKPAKKRVSLIMSRALKLIPNTFVIGYEAYGQYDLIGPQVDYLEAVLEGFEGERTLF
ncbi:MAG: hypothetical protein ACNI27_13060 [Desulfovibrio sp.]